MTSRDEADVPALAPALPTRHGQPRLKRSQWLFFGILLLFGSTLVFEMLLLPSMASAAPVPLGTSATAADDDSDAEDDPAAGATATAAAAAAAAFSLAAAPPAAQLIRRTSAGPPNISVVMPCFGQVPYMEEGLASVIAQEYPAAEILVVDDGSTDRCGEAATKLLTSGSLAAARRKSIRQLQAWWGWGAAELTHFRDEVVLTPNQGVAHARNTGVRRARGDWICCLDADDTIAPNYFMEAMSHVAKAPTTNLVYANQQFFGESKWQWHVPELRADFALVNGPLPLMTLWRKALWHATPHGFDEALPRGHEDWAFWLQLMRLSLHPHHIEDFQVQYR